MVEAHRRTRLALIGLVRLAPDALRGGPAAASTSDCIQARCTSRSHWLGGGSGADGGRDLSILIVSALAAFRLTARGRHRLRGRWRGGQRMLSLGVFQLWRQTLGRRPVLQRLAC